MKLLHRVVKSSQGINVSGVVSIDNTVIVRQKTAQFDDDGELSEVDLKERFNALEQNLEQNYREKLARVEYEKQEILDNAAVHAQAMLSQANNDAERIKQDAKNSGFAQGFQEGKRIAQEELSSQLNAVKQILDQLNSEREAIYIDNENDLIDTAYEMTRKITLSEIKTDKDVIFNIVKQACKNFRNSDYVKISLAKCDVEETVVTDQEFIKKIAGNIPDVEIEILPDAQSGTVILDDNEEIVDASVPTQLDFLKEVLNASKKLI